MQKIPNERLYKVKQTIAQEIAELKTISPVDIAKLMKKLDKAEATLAQLPLKPFKLPTPKPLSQQSWREQLEASLHLLEKLVIVHHRIPGEAPTLTPFYQRILRERIAMDLQQAQWAVLQNNAQVYQQALAEVIKKIKQDAATDQANNTNPSEINPKINAFLEQIEVLQQIQLTPTQPTITQSLSELDAIINNKTHSPNSNIISIPKTNASSPHQGSQLP